MSSSRLQHYRWHGRDSQGRIRRGSMLARSEHEVRDSLQRQSIRIRSITPRPVSLLSRYRQRLNSRDITLLTRQLATMLASGVALLPALQLIAANHNKAPVSALLRSMLRSLESGMPLSAAMQASGHDFDRLYLDLLRSGELSGNLAPILERLAQYRETSEQLRAKVIKALLYPTIVINVAFAVTYLMLTLVIPEFERLFANFGSELPWFTRQVIAASHSLQTLGPWMVAAVALSAAGVGKARQAYPALRLWLSRHSTRLPVLGPLLYKAALARFSRTLSTSLSSGLPLLTSLHSAAKTCGHTHISHALDQVARDTASGMALHLAMRHCHTFPALMLQLVMIGEESGTLDEMLARIALSYENEVDNSVDNLGKILEPLLILLLGGVIGSLVVAMYLPIFNLMSVLG